MRSSSLPSLVGTATGLLVVAVTAVACGSSAPNHARADAGSSTPKVYFAQYGADTHAYRPSRLNPSVDGSLYVSGMRWRVWNDREAVGAGVAHVNDCDPDCADGHYATHPVTVRLAGPRELCGSRFFTSISVEGPGYHTFAHRPGVGCG